MLQNGPEGWRKSTTDKGKIIMPDHCHVILKHSQALNTLTNYNIYIKADKSKAEMREFQRLGKRKKERLVQYQPHPVQTLVLYLVEEAKQLTGLKSINTL